MVSVPHNLGRFLPPHAIHSNTMSGSQIYSQPNTEALSCLLGELILSGLLGSIRERQFNFNCKLKAFQSLWNQWRLRV